MEKKENIGCLTAFLGFSGFFLLLVAILTEISLYLSPSKNHDDGGFDAIAPYLMIPLGVLLLYLAYRKQQNFKKNIEIRKELDKAEKEKSSKIEKNLNKANQAVLERRLKKADDLKKKVSEIQEIKIIDVSDYKKIIIDNEKTILEKGGDNQLFSFMKINTFLNDYRGRIISDQSGLKEVLDIKWLKSRIESEEKRNDLDKISENLEDSLARLEGRKTTGFDASVNSLFELGDLMKPTLENQIKTMEFYRNMAVVMIVFYLDDKKIRYFELYEAFEKLGVFDSTWQKNVLNKLDNIETRLAQMSNQLTELNQNFISLVESSENVVLELKEINSSIVTNNMLQAITAYQTWRINKNTKSIRN